MFWPRGVIAESIKVKLQSAWPDYVISPQADLTSLKYVEAFISENRHLPEIPSAGQASSEGINGGKCPFSQTASTGLF